MLSIRLYNYTIYFTNKEDSIKSYNANRRDFLKNLAQLAGAVAFTAYASYPLFAQDLKQISKKGAKMQTLTLNN
ncbi:twin-arginine translocation signal domain-containing protein, partial [Helicobacter typhlonius]|uniref:twin-arginine translocation signal domain-containing protein n=1 Tax=Helicobacter typhlonius TaxID=76936 RepID=UPI003A5C7A19